MEEQLEFEAAQAEETHPDEEPESGTNFVPEEADLSGEEIGDEDEPDDDLSDVDVDLDEPIMDEVE